MTQLGVHNEYGALQELVVCRPAGLTNSVEPIDDIHRHFQEVDPPVIPKIMPQYEQWLAILRQAGIALHIFDGRTDLPFQVYTRDVGIVVGEQLVLTNLAAPVRRPEITIFRLWLEAQRIPYRVLAGGFLEGGDCLIDAPYVYVGLGQRSNAQGAAALAAVLGSAWEVVPIHLAPGVLHLDCVMALPAPDTLIWCPDAVLDHHELLESRYADEIVVSDAEILHLAPNILSLGPQTVCVGMLQQHLQDQLRARGFTVHSVDWSEIKKFGGMFRCASLPLRRGG